MSNNGIKSLSISIITLVIALLMGQVKAQTIGIDGVHPPFWWTGMQHHRIELMVHGPNIALAGVQLSYPGVVLHSTTRVNNPNYLFLDVEIVPGVAQAGEIPIVFQIGTQKATVVFELKAREPRQGRIQGVGPADVIYLIMPDRFANGDPQNDAIPGMNEPIVGRDLVLHRHGGDLQGIIDHLDYLDSLGITTLWLNPVETNDQPEESYHGYAITNHYQIDPRLGSIPLYQALVDSCHKRGMKVIRDVIYNHVGNNHWLIRDLPSQDWVHQWPSYTQTTYRAPTLLDPYASEADRKLLTDGWFDYHMPDLNQENKHLATYLIQNSLWWIEFFGVDGYRIDTYAYPDQAFMAELTKAILQEYPDFSIFAETWVHGVPVQSWFTEQIAHKALDSHLPGVTDFQLYYAINDALTQDFGWTEGVARLYYTLAKDYVYKDPTRNVVFLDNHDLGRFASTIQEDLDAYRMGIGFLLTTRGIPQVYYGTELLMPNSPNRTKDDRYREDFPGGWPTDPVNKFEAAGRSKKEQMAFDYFQRLATYRQTSPALTEGELMQFVPEKGIYVYARYHPDQTILVMMNQESADQTLSFDRFAERTAGFTTGQDIITGEEVGLDQAIYLPARSIRILELR